MHSALTAVTSVLLPQLLGTQLEDPEALHWLCCSELELPLAAAVAHLAGCWARLLRSLVRRMGRYMLALGYRQKMQTVASHFLWCTQRANQVPGHNA